jgi:hypothetical protein
MVRWRRQSINIKLTIKVIQIRSGGAVALWGYPKEVKASGIVSHATTEMHFTDSPLIVPPHLAKVHKAKIANLYLEATKESLQNHLGECLSEYMNEGLKKHDPQSSH